MKKLTIALLVFAVSCTPSWMGAWRTDAMKYPLVFKVPNEQAQEMWVLASEYMTQEFFTVTPSEYAILGETSVTGKVTLSRLVGPDSTQFRIVWAGKGIYEDRIEADAYGVSYFMHTGRTKKDYEGN